MEARKKRKMKKEMEVMDRRKKSDQFYIGNLS